MTFEQWLETELGAEVYRRIMNNHHNADMDRVASYFDTIEDIQQKALIWLWEHWQDNPGFTDIGKDAVNFSPHAAILTKLAIWNARCMYAKRRIEGREKQTDLYAADNYQRVHPDAIRTTDIHPHDKINNPKRDDVQEAIQNVTYTMARDYSIAPGNHRRIPIVHITETIIEGYMYHYVDRYSQRGNFRQFCESRGVGRNVIQKWRPIILTRLRAELEAYAC